MKARHPTSLVRLRYLEERLRLQHVYAKCEIDNPTGTQKDRIAGGLVRAALEAQAAGITVGTCGNLGVALALGSRSRGMPCTVFVPRSFRRTRAEEITALGAELFSAGECYEAAVDASRRYARDRDVFDANPVGAAGEIAIAAYGAIVDELLAQSPVALGSIWLPVGNGTCAAGIGRRLRALGHLASVGVVGSAGNTALIASLASGRLVELEPATLRQTDVNEPLVNWRSLHAREAMDAVVGSGGSACEATDDELIAACDDLWTGVAVRTTPAGSAGLVGLDVFAAELDPSAAHVVVLTA